MMDGIINVLIWVMSMTHHVTNTWALDIILLTILVRVVLFPLNRKMSKSMKLMQKVQPEMKALQEKYKEKPDQLQKETMELYRKFKINPLDSCWPMALQMPVFFALFRILRDPLIYLRLPGFENATLLGLSLTIPPQMSHPYPEIALKAGVYDLYSLIPIQFFADRFLYTHSLILLLVYIATTIIQSKQMQAQSQAASSGQPNTMALMMPMFIFFGLLFPTGLLAYFITSNVLQMTQYWGIQREIALEESLEEGALPKEPGTSWLSNKMALFSQKGEDSLTPNKGKPSEGRKKKKK
jgi:YidC/Oxa1 family membrane protein insertase